MYLRKILIVYTLLLVVLFAFDPALFLQNSGHNFIRIAENYLGTRQSPGDSIGTTWYDFQASGSFGQRVDVDDLRQAHIVWTKMDGGQTTRFVAWNLRYDNGSYYGETQASPSWSGHVQMDITRDLVPEDQRTVIVYSYNNGAGYYAWVDIDACNAWGAWPNNPRSLEIPGHMWPYIAVANNNYFVLATWNGADSLYLYTSSDEGMTWSYIMGFDSCAVPSQFVRASEKRDTNKVAFVHTQYITDSVASGQLDNDVYYMVSQDGGINWGEHINITNYQAYDTVRAFCDVNAVFDHDDHVHIAWTGRKVDSTNYYQASKIFHWDEYHDTITVVNSPSMYYNEPGGWWIPGSLGEFGGWRMPADQPQLVCDTTTHYLYCLWHGNDDTTDISANGYFNGELYGAYSTDGGIIWSDYVNLTNTRTPGCGPGECCDEDYMTACPKVVTDSIFITYIEDKDAGAGVATNPECVITENPVRCWVFWTGLIRTGIEEEQGTRATFQEPVLRISPNPFFKLTNISLSKGHHRIENSSYRAGSAEGIELRIYDASGRLVRYFSLPTAYSLVSTIKWSGDDQHGYSVPAGVYFVELKAKGRTITKKVIKLK